MKKKWLNLSKSSARDPDEDERSQKINHDEQQQNELPEIWTNELHEVKRIKVRFSESHGNIQM